MVSSLSDKFEKEGKKGLVLICVTDENVATVDAWYKKAQPRYPIAALEDAMSDGNLEKAWAAVVSLKAKAGKDEEQDRWAEREFTAVAKIYAKVAAKYPDTRLAEAAHARATFLVEDGYCGYESTCDDCKQGDAACDKHDEGDKVKL